MRRPIFLDRDGVINVDISPYVSKVEDLKLFPWTVDAMRRLNEAGFDIYVISNQQGVAKGITKPEDLELITEAIQDALRPHGFEVRKFYYCTWHKSDNHSWRKPRPGMILAAIEEYSLDVGGAFMIGDKWSDVEAGARAGCRPLLVLSGVTAKDEWQSWAVKPEAAFENLSDAVDYVLENAGAGA
jgi:D-glycero-D-manno-heptose 1,7-bisphosphate phosphatase